MERVEQNAVYTGAEGVQNTYDMTLPNNYNGTVLLFMHGFMGFKDWGCWKLFMDHFVNLGFGFCRFNVSHNGTTIEHPNDFVATEAFGKDSYFMELTDLKIMIELVRSKIGLQDKLILIGHSRGGGVVLLGSNDDRVSAVVSLAGISSIEKRFPSGEGLEGWRNTGVKYVHNTRTGQDLPQYFSQYEDFQQHKSELSIQDSCKELKKPVLLIHGDGDESVSISEGYELASYCQTDLKVIEGADHTFGSTMKLSDFYWRSS
jgi:uncharacterized protein